jgi:uncharacterized membrane protein YdjX (TVP38/TMEM64 family)
VKIDRKNVLYIWLAFLFFIIPFLYFNPSLIRDIFTYLSGKSPVYLYSLIFILGIVRSFTLIPVTYLIILGLIFVPATPLYFIIMSGVMVSSILVYYFFEYLQIDKFLESRYSKQVKSTKYYLSKYEFPVIFFWAMNPILPSDVICYAAGTLRINFYKFIVAMLVGEGLACAVYIFGGKFLLNSLFGINI